MIHRPLQQIVLGTMMQRVGDEAIVVAAGEDDDGDLVDALFEAAERFEIVRVGEAEVEEDDGLACVGCARHMTDRE